MGFAAGEEEIKIPSRLRRAVFVFGTNDPIKDEDDVSGIRFSSPKTL